MYLYVQLQYNHTRVYIHLIQLVSMMGGVTLTQRLLYTEISSDETHQTSVGLSANAFNL